MKKFFTLIAAVALAASVNAQVLTFTQKYAKGSVPATFSADGLELKVVDTDGKMEGMLIASILEQLSLIKIFLSD